MDNYQRFAVYAAPPPGPLADFTARWLGWDPVAGASGPPPDLSELPGLPRPLAALTEAPRKYGFHATLKPPFRLAEGCRRADLEADLARLAASRPPVLLAGLRLARLGGFVALVPEGETGPLAALAGACVAELDAHRAPAPAAELARRRAAGLTPRQEANLTAWGYPYVFDDFRFHFTLTGKLPEPEAAAVVDALTPQLVPLLPRPFALDALALFGEAPDGRFHLLHRYTLAG